MTVHDGRCFLPDTLTSNNFIASHMLGELTPASILNVSLNELIMGMPEEGWTHIYTYQRMKIDTTLSIVR